MRKILITCLFFLPLISMAAATYKISWVNEITPGSVISSDKIAGDQCIQSVEPPAFSWLGYGSFWNTTLIDNNNIGYNCTNKDKYQSWIIWDTLTGEALVGEVKFRHWLTGGLGVFGSWRTSIDVPQWDYTKVQVNAMCFHDAGRVTDCINSADGIKDVTAVCIVFTQRGHKPGLSTALRCSAGS